MFTRSGCLKAALIFVLIAITIVIFFLFYKNSANKREPKPEPPLSYINQVRIGVSERSVKYFVNSLNDLIKGNGYEISMVNLKETDESWEMLAAGSLDIVVATIPDLALGFARHRPGAVIFNAISSNGSDAVVAGKRITKLEDLAGKRISLVPHCSDYIFFTLLLDKIGKTTQECNIIFSPTQEKANALLERGIVDATVLSDPYLDKALVKGYKSIESTVSLPVIDECFVAGNTFRRNYPERVKDVLKAWFEMILILNKNPGVGKRLISRKNEINPEKLSRLISRMKFFTLEDNQGISEKELYRKILKFQKFWSIEGELNAHLNISPDVIDFSFVKDLSLDDINSVLIDNKDSSVAIPAVEPSMQVESPSSNSPVKK